MAYVWPELSVGAQRENFPQAPAVDPTLRSMTLDGRVVARRAPRRILYTFMFVLRYLTAEDKELLEAFQEEIRVGGETFTWTDERPGDNTAGNGGEYTVRLAERMTFDLDDDGSAYRTEVYLVQEPED